MTAAPRLMSKAEAAAYCALTPSTFSDWVRRGILPKPIKGTTRWDRKLVDIYLDRQAGIAKGGAGKGTGELTAADYLARYDEEKSASH